ncbi:hypothetical protein [Chelativorans sp.]|uniref:hypothetical protein n=1 Tax=Chelativorans sp. TaxID=2203393 RepID=UPI002810F514|nr:hypothetical protein [Chelativorans sp.]
MKTRRSDLVLLSLATVLAGAFSPSLRAQEAPPAAPTAPSAQTEQQIEGALQDGVEVSLGREEIKQQIAKDLGISEVEVPLSVHLPPEIADQVCPQTEFEVRSNENRSCTASNYLPELAEAARGALE